MTSKRAILGTFMALMWLSGCAVKPPEQVAHGEDHNLFKKSDLLAKSPEQALAKENSISSRAMLTGATQLLKDYPAYTKVLVEQGPLKLVGDEQVTFDISESYLTVYVMKQGRKTPVQQYAITGHYDLAPQTNADGVESHVLIRNTTKRARWQDRAYIEVDPFDPLEIKADEDTMRDLYAVQDLKDKVLVFLGQKSLPFMRAQDLRALQASGDLALGMKLKLTLSENFLTVWIEGSETIIAQASIGYVDLVRRKNARDEITPDLIRDNKENPWEARSFVAVDPTDVQILESNEDLLENLYKKALFAGTFQGLAKVPAVGQLLAQEPLLNSFKDDVVSVRVTQVALEVLAGSEVIATFALSGHYDLAQGRTPEGEQTVALERTVKNNEWTAREYVAFDPRMVSFPTPAGKSVKKSDLAACMLVQDLPIAGVEAAIMALDDMSADDSVCVVITQTIVSVHSQSASGDLLATFDIVRHFDIGTENPNWEAREYVQIDVGNPQKVENTVKDNALAKDLFAGEFLYAATIMDVHSENGLFFPGASLQSEDRLRFEFSEDYVTLYKVNEPLNESSVPSPMLRYRADQFDIKRVENYYGDLTNVIAEDTEAPWQNRSHARVDFASNQIPGYFNEMLGVVTRAYGMVMTAESRMVANVKIEDGYIEFETEEIMTPNASAGFSGAGETRYEPVAMKIKHVFMRVGDRNYAAKEYNEYDFARFGFFRTTEYGIDPEQGKTDDSLKHYINRFDIADGKKIDYYLSPNFPEKYVDEMEEVVAAWNDAFKAATGQEGVMVLHKDKDKDFGDPRVNMIVYVDGYRASAPLGYGPSFFDPTTGENISAKAYIYDDGIRYMNRVASLYYDLVTGETGLLDLTRETSGPIAGAESGFETDLRTMALPRTKQQATQAISAVGPSRGIRLDKIMERLKAAGGSVDQSVVKGELADDLVAKSNAFERSVNDARKALNDGHQGCAYEVDEHIASAIKFVQAYSHLPKEELLAELESRMIFNLTMHEVGHNIGLRHNFHGSFDETNFPAEYHTLKGLGEMGLPDPIAAGEWVYKYRGSSVMDYFDDFEALYKAAGPYDVAAIKFGYGDKMEVVVGQDQFGALVTEDIKKQDYLEVVEEMRQQRPGANRATWEALASQVMGVRPYKFCTDGHVWEDPTCNRFDRGVNVTEITQSLIEDYEIRYFLSGFRRGRRNFTGGSGYILDMYILPVRQLFDEYVYNIIYGMFTPEGAGSQDDYLTALNLGFDFFDKILSTVEPGDYVLNQETGEFEPGNSQDPEAIVLNVGLDYGKYLLSRFEPVGTTERVLNRGIELDKIGVLWAMSMRGYPAEKYERASLTLNYFDLVKDFAFDRFSRVMRDDLMTDIAVAPTEAGTFVPAAGAEPMFTAKIKPSTSLALQQYALIFAASNYNNSADHGFGDYVDFRIKGIDDSFPEGTAVAEFKTAGGLKTIVVPNTADGLGISYAIGVEAEQVATALAQMQEQLGDLPDDRELVVKIVDLFSEAWEIGEGAAIDSATRESLLGNLASYVEAINGIMGQWIEAAADEETRASLAAIQEELTVALTEYATMATVKDEINTQVDEMQRQLREAEAELESMREIYQVFY